MQPVAVPDEQVLRAEADEPSRRLQAQRGVDADRLLARAEERDRPERVGAHEDALLRPPERDLLPEPVAHDGQHRERRARQLPWRDVVRHLEPRGHCRGGTVVAVEQLEHARRLAEREHVLLDALRLDRIDEPDAAVDDERVARLRLGGILDPAEPEVGLVRQADGHAAPSCSKARSNVSSGWAPSTSSRESSRKAGTAFAPIETACWVAAATRSR